MGWYGADRGRVCRMTQFRCALAFLTRLPGGRHPDSPSDLTRAVPWFPVVGGVVGALGAGMYVGALELVGPLPAAALAFALTALVTGGFHEDGLADSLDGLAGGWDREQRLEILEDSRHGTFGVLALVLVSIVKISALATLAGWAAAGALVAAHVGGRAGAVALMGVAPTAREVGLGADYTRSLRPIPTIAGSCIGVAVLVAVFQAWTPVAIVAVVGGVAIVGFWAGRKIGGVTGDVLGAAEQVGECAVLLAASAVLV